MTPLQQSLGRAVTRQQANVRAEPNGTAAIVRTAPKSATLRVYARNGTWIWVGDTQPWGWIHASLLDQVP